MMNFGLSDLRLVAPREEWPHQRAYDLAASAAPILDSAKVFASLREAVAGCQHVYAVTARSREMIKPVYAPKEAMERILRHGAEHAALVFGPERTGLSNDDIAIADAIITIPTSPELASLNVGQSVVVLAYEWFQASAGGFAITATTGRHASPVGEKFPPASKQELQGFLDKLERELDAVDFWKVDDKKPKMWLNLRNIFTRNELTEQEVRTLHGVVAELIRGRHKK